MQVRQDSPSIVRERTVVEHAIMDPDAASAIKGSSRGWRTSTGRTSRSGVRSPRCRGRGGHGREPRHLGDGPCETQEVGERDVPDGRRR